MCEDSAARSRRGLASIPSPSALGGTGAEGPLGARCAQGQGEWEGEAKPHRFREEMGTERGGEGPPSHGPAPGPSSFLQERGDGGRGRFPVPCSSCSLSTSAPGAQDTQATYLRALQQQVLEGRPELSLEDLLQLPGQRLSGFPGALSREGGKARPQGHPGTHLHWPPAQHGRQPDPQSRRPTSVWQADCLSQGQSDTVQSPLPTSAAPQQAARPQAQPWRSAGRTPVPLGSL